MWLLTYLEEARSEGWRGEIHIVKIRRDSGLRGPEISQSFWSDICWGPYLQVAVLIVVHRQHISTQRIYTHSFTGYPNSNNPPDVALRADPHPPRGGAQAVAIVPEC